jgi:hypothetical protein
MSNNAAYIKTINGNIAALLVLLREAVKDAVVAANDAEKGKHLAAVGALLPTRQILADAKALLDATMVLNHLTD